jgi:purine nucleoside phosphorylase
LRIRRHGVPHRFAPHAINYAANIAAFRALAVDGIIALNTVGGISAEATTGALVLPDQLIDYTWGRRCSFSPDDAVEHFDFTEPFDTDLCAAVVRCAQRAGIDLIEGGTMAVTQGPRLETAAEIRRLAADGCSVVGMTGMPEAALAREAQIPYACVCLVVNPAAGMAVTAVAKSSIDLEAMAAVSAAGMAQVSRLLQVFCEFSVEQQ